MPYIVQHTIPLASYSEIKDAKEQCLRFPLQLGDEAFWQVWADNPNCHSNSHRRADVTHKTFTYVEEEIRGGRIATVTRTGSIPTTNLGAFHTGKLQMHSHKYESSVRGDRLEVRIEDQTLRPAELADSVGLHITVAYLEQTDKHPSSAYQGPSITEHQLDNLLRELERQIRKSYGIRMSSHKQQLELDRAACQQE